MEFLASQYFKNLPDDDKLLVKKLLDWVRIAENKFIVKFSYFLDKKQCNLCESILALMKYENYKFYGGYDNAVRKVLAIYPQHYDAQSCNFPLKPVMFSYRECDSLTHGDFLGCLMSCQVSREMIGDISVGNGRSVVFLYDTIYNYIIDNIKKIGSVGVSVSTDISDFNFNIENDFQQIKGIVSSLRLDCLISVATKLSREKASLLIKSVGVNVNYSIIKSSSFVLNEGDVFSLIGYGKFIFKSVVGITKKDRICIIISKYV